MTTLTWSGGPIDGTPWQGLRYLSITIDPTATPPVVLVGHLNQPVGTLQPDQVRIGGGRRLPPHPDSTHGPDRLAAHRLAMDNAMAPGQAGRPSQ